MSQSVSQDLLRYMDQFGDSTEDCYFYYDCAENQVWFSQNVREVADIFPGQDVTCSLEDWLAAVVPMDLPKLKRLFEELSHGETRQFNLNYRIWDRNGNRLWISSRGRAYPGEDGRTGYVLGRFSRQAQTGYISGPYHHDGLMQTLNRYRAQGLDGFLVAISVDGLERINVKCGRAFGDAVIKTLWESMTAAIQNGELVFRTSGDCYCALLPTALQAEAEGYFEKVQETLRDQCTISGGAVSIQTYQVPESYVLLQYAESALDTARLRGKNRLCFFSPRDYERKLAAVELQEELEAAVRGGFKGFSIQFQAQVRSESYALHGAEALLRFDSPRRGPIQPAEFIPILEESELICPVGMWVLRQGLEHCRQWRMTNPRLHLSVNMSYAQLCQPEIQSDVLRILRESGVPGSALTIEVTESMALKDYPQLNTIFRAWKKEGIQVSVDDFGTGYSSLSWLKELAIDEIKIDRCFVSEIQNSAYNLRLLSNLMELADSCQIRVCCEGVEKLEELSVLNRLRPALYQGFYFARPCTPGTFARSMLGGRFAPPNLAAPVQTVDARDTQTVMDGLEHDLLDETEEIISICDVKTYEICYLNPAAQKAYGVRDYLGLKCHKVFYGLDAPCPWCTNGELRQDSFHVREEWNEYCRRHLLLKEKVLGNYGGRFRLGVATDITKGEYVSQRTQERLAFSQKVVEYVEALSKQRDFGHAVLQALAAVGEFYKADRAYLFERNPVREDHWDNTYEWCDHHVASMRDSLQCVPPEGMRRWMERFANNQSVVIYNLEALRKNWPVEWEDLSKQGIQRLIAVPFREKGRLVGFIGVDNPRYSIEDDAQIRLLSYFLALRRWQERNDCQP